MDVSELTVDEYLALSPGAIRDLRAAISSNFEDLFKSWTNELSEWVCARSCGRARSWRRKVLFSTWFKSRCLRVTSGSGHVDRQVGTGVFTGKAVVEQSNKPVQFRLQTPELCDIHVESSLTPWWEDRFARSRRERKTNLAL
jgi:hypothetical protein